MCIWIYKKGAKFSGKGLDAKVSETIAWIIRLKVDARTWMFCQNKGK